MPDSQPDTPSHSPPPAVGSPPPARPKRNLSALLVPFIPILLALLVAAGIKAYKARHTHSTPQDASAALAVGSLAPDFTLPDAHDQAGDHPITLSLLADKSPVVVLFYLGYSCPRCVSHLQEISDRINEFKKAGLQVIAISPDTLAEIKDSIGVYGDFHFPLLADPNEKVCRAFGLIEPDGGMHHGLFLIDTTRHIQFLNISDHPYTDLDALLAMAAAKPAK